MSLDSERPRLAANDLDDLIAAARPTLFVATLALAWMTLEPFASLGNTQVLELASGREGLTYAAFGLIALASAGLVFTSQARVLLALVTPWSLALGAWLLVTVVTSQDFSSSLKRFVLFGFVAAITASLFLLPNGRRQLGLLLLIAMGGLLALSYLGVALLPMNAIHQATDVMEDKLAGDWRGVFSHKNNAGAIFAMGVFMGIHGARIGYRAAGIAIAVFCALFVVFAGAKSALMLLVVTLVISGLVTVVRSNVLRALLVATPLVTLLVLGPGTVLSDTLAGIVRALPVDATFTGRSDIWVMAFDHIAERPLTGYGYGAFWTLESTKFGSEDLENWAGSAAHAHNGYIEAALNLGIPGLVLVVLVMVVQPFRDFTRARSQGADPALTMMLFQIWLFGIYLSVMESFLFTRVDSIWITFLFAVFGLRYVARFPGVRA
jgi:O-antigen ligase